MDKVDIYESIISMYGPAKVKAKAFLEWNRDVKSGKLKNPAEGIYTTVKSFLDSSKELEDYIKKRQLECVRIKDGECMRKERNNFAILMDYLSILIGCNNEIGDNLLGIVRREKIRSSGRKLESLGEIEFMLTNKCQYIGLENLRKLQ